jgi:hypothetical protein
LKLEVAVEKRTTRKRVSHSQLVAPSDAVVVVARRMLGRMNLQSIETPKLRNFSLLQFGQTFSSMSSS